MCHFFSRLFLLLIALTIAAPAQEPPPTTIRVDVEEILVDIVVRDRRGRPIRDLKAGEIEVFEDGLKMEALGLRLIEGREVLSLGERKTLDPLRQLRLVSLVFDRLGAESMRLAREAAQEIVKRSEKETNVFIAVFRLDPNLRVVQEFTRDREALRRAIQYASAGTAGPNTAARTAPAGPAAPAAPPPATPGPGQAPDGAAFAEQAMARAIEQVSSSIESAASQMQGTMSLTSLLALIKGQQQLAGRKTAIYFSEGLFLDQNTDALFDNLVGEANRTNLTFYAVDARGLIADSQMAGAGADLVKDVARAAEAARREGGAITRADMTATDTRMNALRRNVQQNLAELAMSTGGFLIADTNDFRNPMTRVTEDVLSYYETSYRPSNRNFDGKYRKLEVRVNRPNTVVQARVGYFALPPEFRDVMFAWEIPLLKSLAENPPPRDLEFRSAVYRFSGGDGLVKGVLDLEIPLNRFQVAKDPEQKNYYAHFSLVALLKDPQGKVVRKFQRDIPYSGPIDRLELFEAGNFIYSEPFEAAPGRYLLEAALTDRIAGKIGARRSNILLPAPPVGKAAISSLALIRRVEAVEGPDHLGDPFRFPGGKVTPTLDARIPAGVGAQISIYCVIYTGGPKLPKPQMFMEFLLDGQSLGKAEAPLPEPDASGAMPYIANIPAEKWPPGQYEVKATVVQNGQVTAEESANFVIEPK